MFLITYEKGVETNHILKFIHSFLGVTNGTIIYFIVAVPAVSYVFLKFVIEDGIILSVALLYLINIRGNISLFISLIT
jgi:hypothetical protein